MTAKELVKALRRLKVQTGSLACLGCGYEHNCSIHGCAIIREAAEWLGCFQCASVDESIVTMAAAKYLGVSPSRLRELAEAEKAKPANKKSSSK